MLRSLVPTTAYRLAKSLSALERRGYLRPEIIEADKIILAEGLDSSCGYRSYGPEWPFHIGEIRASYHERQCHGRTKVALPHR